jgi:phosphoglycerate dehydrogenase-like enzyme
MVRSILVIDPAAGLFHEKLSAAFPSVQVNAVPDLETGRRHGPEAEVMFGMPRAFDAPMLASASRLKWIQAGTAGTDFLMRIPTLKPDTLITSTRGIHGPQMAEMALLLMMALARRLPQCLENQRQHLWKRPEQRRLFGKTALILGIGQSGSALGLMCKAMGMRVIGVSNSRADAPGFDRVVPRSALIDSIREAHFVVAVLPYDKDTHHIMNAEVLAAMRPDAYFVNIARGGIVDEPALIEALRAKRIAGAGLDVASKEPLPPESPLWALDNVIITPHAAGECEEYHELALEIFEKNLRCYLDGRVSDMVNLVRR